jgi:glycosyltransferase involved in cell wall biosynthesis
MSDSPVTILLDWRAATHFGWGLLGYNVFLNLAQDPAVVPVMGRQITADFLAGVNPLVYAANLAAINRSNHLTPDGGTWRQSPPDNAVIIEGFGNNLEPINADPPISRGPCIARWIFEHTGAISNPARLDPYGSVLCASHWAEAQIQAVTRKPVHMIHEGIDPALFFPGPKSGLTGRGRFCIFSGGKLEFRKGQDIVLAAFREFARRHDDVFLITAWQSLWPDTAVGFSGCLSSPLKKRPNGQLDIVGWAEENGVRPGRVADIGFQANSTIPTILREMDCAIQVSRAEACTNLVAMEAMATGLPVILADNTGVRDLVGEGNCVPMRRQTPVDPAQSGGGSDGWGESDVEEILSGLEMLYTDSEKRRLIGSTAASWIVENGRTWPRHAELLKSYIRTL